MLQNLASRLVGPQLGLDPLAAARSALFDAQGAGTSFSQANANMVHSILDPTIRAALRNPAASSTLASSGVVSETTATSDRAAGNSSTQGGEEEEKSTSNEGKAKDEAKPSHSKRQKKK